MVKLRKDKTIVLGLSYENINRMKNDQPIKFDGKDVNLDGFTFYIIAAKDESEMINMFYDQIGPETKLT